MLADAVEAASRTVADPNPAKVRALIRTLVEDCLADGQLDQTDLTLGDLNQDRPRPSSACSPTSSTAASTTPGSTSTPSPGARRGR